MDSCLLTELVHLQKLVSKGKYNKATKVSKKLTKLLKTYKRSC